MTPSPIVPNPNPSNTGSTESVDVQHDDTISVASNDSSTSLAASVREVKNVESSLGSRQLNVAHRLFNALRRAFSDTFLARRRDSYDLTNQDSSTSGANRETTTRRHSMPEFVSNLFRRISGSYSLVDAERSGVKHSQLPTAPADEEPSTSGTSQAEAVAKAEQPETTKASKAEKETPVDKPKKAKAKTADKGAKGEAKASASKGEKAEDFPVHNLEPDALNRVTKFIYGNPEIPGSILTPLELQNILQSSALPLTNTEGAESFGVLKFHQAARAGNMLTESKDYRDLPLKTQKLVNKEFNKLLGFDVSLASPLTGMITAAVQKAAVNGTIAAEDVNKVIKAEVDNVNGYLDKFIARNRKLGIMTKTEIQQRARAAVNKVELNAAIAKRGAARSIDEE